MTTVDELRLYTLPEVAERLHVTEDWLTKRLRDGRLSGRKSGVKWTMSAADIRAAIDSMAARADTEKDSAAAEVSRKGAER
ncbi:helix-turn-helix domain-containing protein [Nocardia arizonensis]|uniref:helix-turn-helix domain-containing protein n=1 Tax=Nocardia arizonensis TaxID=1141647 RepID=UPI0006D11615|nr:helix-turn-helix domain-containing protein [Nocardia arizonensis]